MKYKGKLIEDIEVYCCCDYPDFSDSYIESCLIDGQIANDEELNEINEDFDFVYECVLKNYY